MSQFVPNELVWVKLGGVQWPAVVKDKSDPDCEEFLEALKRDPIVVVAFFDKKLHDVHNRNQICRYNCEEKEDIVLKSLQLTRNKSDLSENFKKDVITAEKLTDGDIHILSRDKFSSTGRQKYDELFGSTRKSASKPSAKRKAPRPSEDAPKSKASKYSDLFPESPSKNKRLAAKPKKPVKPAAESPRPNITHPRFIAENDHEIRILAPASPEARTVSPSTSHPYRCFQCGFTTARLNVLVLHNKTHIAAASAKPTTAKRKNGTDSGESTPKKKKRPAPADGSAAKASKASKASRGDDTPKKSPKASPKKSAPGTPKKSPKKDEKPDPEKPKTPVKTPAKLSPLKPAHSSRPQLLEDWDEDDAEEEAERAKIQSEIDRFISDKRTPKKDAAAASTAVAGSPSTSTAASPTASPEAASIESPASAPTSASTSDATVALTVASAASPTKVKSEGKIKTEETVKEESVGADFALPKPDVERTGTAGVADRAEAESAADRAEAESAADRAAAESAAGVATLTKGLAAVASGSRDTEEDEAAAMRQRQRERNDALLQAAVDHVLADTAPAALPSLPPGVGDFTAPGEPEVTPPRGRPVRVCPAGSPPLPHPPDTDLSPDDLTTFKHEDVTSSRPIPTSSVDAPPTSVLPANLQILSVPGSDGQPDTYVLVSVDERGNVQPVSPPENLAGLGADTLLAYEVAQEDGSTRTAYLNPAALSTSADISQLLGAEGGVDSTTPLPDSSGK